MSDDDALLRAVLAAPDEDAPRLAYADWLQESGLRRRADFIRRGVRRSSVEHVDNVPHRVAVRGAGQFLPYWSRVPVRGWLPAPAPTHRLIAEFRRGFLSAIECPAEWWVANADSVAATHPLRRVVLTTVALSDERSDRVPLPISWFVQRHPEIDFSTWGW